MTRWLSKWLILALTVLWLAWELIANFDTSAATWPLTHLIRTYVSPWIYFPAVLGLAGWLVWHFWPAHDRSVSSRGLIMSVTPGATPSPTVVKRSAATSFVRSLGQGLVVTVLGALAAWLPTAFADGVRWTNEYWTGLGISLAGAVTLAVVSYVHGLVSPRKVP